jgi:Icc-related predicted phosphoesterase
MIKIWHISDTHGFHKLLDIPSGIDIVIHSGDCSNSRDPFNNESEVRKFIDWYKDIPIKNKVYVAGNHDTSIESKLVTKEDFQKAGITYLENEYATILGLKIFGSPHTPMFGNWAFMRDRVKLERFWRKAMNEDCDIVVTHGPPKGALDKSYNRDGRMEHCGDRSLLNRILDIKPKLSLFGHIHNCEDIINAGVLKFSVGETLFSNGSVVTDGKFGKLSSNGNVLYLNKGLWQKLKRYTTQLLSN